jgi:choice-of-anchor A domain-containing protein
MYQVAGSLKLSGSAAGGATNNRPENFVYFGLPGVTAIAFSGNASFVGVIYAPEADFTQSGGGNSDIDFRGSIVVKSITVNGNFALHYDDSLAGYYYGYYAVGSWQEL